MRVTWKTLMYVFLMRLNPQLYYVRRWSYLFTTKRMKKKKSAARKRAWKLQAYFARMNGENA